MLNKAQHLNTITPPPHKAQKALQQKRGFSGLFWRFPVANKLSKSFYRHFSIAICLYFHEVSGKIIFPDTFPETYLNSTCTCHFLYHKVSGKYVSGKIFPDSWKNVMILAANHVNDYLDARVCHSLQKILSFEILRCGQKIRKSIMLK